MKVLMHYTTQRHVFNCFSQNDFYSFTKDERIKKISEFYDRYNRTQIHLFFVVSFFEVSTGVPMYSAGTISLDDDTDTFKYKIVSPKTLDLICEELGLKDSNTYDNKSFYREFTIEGHEKDFINIKNEDILNKIRLKFFTWEELFQSNETLFNEINNIIFDKDNVLKVASTYAPKIKYTDKQKSKKYSDALKSIGFISDVGLNTSHTTLHGDIGEFLMHIILSRFLCEESSEKYLYPKLVLKTSPKMPVFGNDGTIYLKDKKEIYYLEAKFYSKLKDAIDKAVESLTTHNEVDQEHLNHRIEMFRNIKTDELSEVIELDEDIKENLVLFLMCDNYTNYCDISKVVKANSKLTNLKTNFNIVLFVLPIINKEEFLRLFSLRSDEVLEKINEK